MLFTIFSLALSAPLPAPDKAEIQVAHTDAQELILVHTAGLTDRALFAAAHNPNAPNPPNSKAAQLAAAGTSVNLNGPAAQAATAMALQMQASFTASDPSSDNQAALSALQDQAASQGMSQADIQAIVDKGTNNANNPAAGLGAGAIGKVLKGVLGKF